MLMSAREILADFKRQLEEDEKKLAEVDLLLKTSRDAGEPDIESEATQRTIRARITAWKKAIATNSK